MRGGRAIAVHAALAIAGLAFAYQTWTREEEVEQVEGEVVVLDCDASQLTSIELETPTHFFRAKPSPPIAGDTSGIDPYWLQMQRRPPKPRPAAKDAGADAGDAAAATPAEKLHDDMSPRVKDALYKENDFLANKEFGDYVRSILPFKALRGLGVIDEDEFEPFGFDKVGTFYRLECGGTKLDLEVGGRTFGAQNLYLRDPKSGEVYLFPATTVQDLKSITHKFMQSKPHDFEIINADEALVKARGTERRLWHRSRKIKAEAHWVAKDEPDKRNEVYSNWLSRLARLRVIRYLKADQKPGDDLDKPEGPPEPIVTIEYTREGEPGGKLEMVKVPADDTHYYYIKTEATRVWTVVHDGLGQQIEKDVGLVLGIEEPAEPVRVTTGAPGTPAAAQAPVGPGSHAEPDAPKAPGVLPSGHPPVAPQSPHGAPPAAPKSSQDLPTGHPPIP